MIYFFLPKRGKKLKPAVSEFSMYHFYIHACTGIVGMISLLDQSHHVMDDSKAKRGFYLHINKQIYGYILHNQISQQHKMQRDTIREKEKQSIHVVTYNQISIEMRMMVNI